MNNISQSDVTLNSMAIDDSSTPSNQSEYFSVTSSLDILNGSDDVYYSMDEDSSGRMQRKFQRQKIIIENYPDFEDEKIEESINEVGEVPTIFIQEHLLDEGDWDRNGYELYHDRSQESLSSEDDNNFSTLTDSVNNTFSVDKPNSENDEDGGSLTGNNVTQMTNSVIEGELSDMNDVIYESSSSQQPCKITVEDDDNRSLGIEDEEQSIIAHDRSILELVREIEFSELDSCDPDIVKDGLVRTEGMVANHKYGTTVTEDIVIEEAALSKASPLHKLARETNDHSSDKKFKHGKARSKHIEVSDESPTKTSSLCCSIRRKKIKNNPPNTSVQTSKSKSLFSFLKIYKKDRSPLKSPKSLPELNASKEQCDQNAKAQENIEYRGIPFIDADVGFYSDAYIPLARHEVFCEAQY